MKMHFKMYSKIITVAVLLLFFNLIVTMCESRKVDDDDDAFEVEDDEDDEFEGIGTGANERIDEEIDPDEEKLGEIDEEDEDEEIESVEKEEFIDPDEFVGIPETRENDALKSKKSFKADFISPEKKTYLFEYFALGLVAIYIVVYFIGKSANLKIATDWVNSMEKLIKEQFETVGINSEMLVKEADNSFKFYATGRRYCTGLLATIELQMRQDLFSYVLSMLEMAPAKDTLTIEIPLLPNSVEPFVLALVKKKYATKFRKENADVERFTSMVSSKVVKESMLMSDALELEKTIFDKKVVETINDLFDLFISLHITDLSSRSWHTSKNQLTAKFSMPKTEKDIQSVLRLTEMCLYIVDIVSTKVKISPPVRAKIDKKRKELKEEEFRASHEQRLENAQRVREEKQASLSSEARKEAMQKKEAKKLKKRTQVKAKVFTR